MKKVVIHSTIITATKNGDGLRYWLFLPYPKPNFLGIKKILYAQMTDTFLVFAPK